METIQKSKQRLEQAYGPNKSIYCAVEQAYNSLTLLQTSYVILKCHGCGVTIAVYKLNLLEQFVYD